MWYWWFMAGFAVGVVIELIFHAMKKPDGVFMIDKTDPEKDIYRLDINELETVANKSILKLKVNCNATLSNRDSQETQ